MSSLNSDLFLNVSRLDPMLDGTYSSLVNGQ
jgi:hypothetical protein